MTDSKRKFGEIITKLIAGKTVVRCENIDIGPDDFLQFIFSDGTVLRFRHDWIYEWEIPGIINE